jgi:hypothetical protein
MNDSMTSFDSSNNSTTISPTASFTTTSTITISTTATNSTTTIFGNEIAKVFFLLFAFAVLICIRIWLNNKYLNLLAETRQINHPDSHAHEHNNDGNSITNRMKKLSTEDLMGIYNKTFVSNGNQIILKSEHIEKQNYHNDDDCCNNCEALEDIELGNGSGDQEQKQQQHQQQQQQQHQQSGNTHLCEHDQKTNCENDTTTSTRTLIFTVPDRGGEYDNGKASMTVNGTCVICFDNFKKDDEIVWSQENKKKCNNNNIDTDNNNNNYYCNHIYHKECMVNYLASNAKRRIKKNLPMITTTSDDDVDDITTKNDINSKDNDSINPCPTCRQNFCSISEEDLVSVNKNIKSVMLSSSLSSLSAAATVTEDTESPPHDTSAADNIASE